MKPNRLAFFAATTAITALASTSSAIQVAAQQMCSTPVGGYCGNAQGSLCCPASAYCQPWNVDYYQCLALPTGCRDFETDVDYAGNDIGSVSKVSSAECCAKCQATSGCNYFTFVNLDPAGPTCYMKSANANRVRKVGVVSARPL